MAYGAEDRRAPLIHGESMRDALVKNGTLVEWAAYPGEGYGFLVEANRIDFYTRVAKVLTQHLGAKVPSVEPATSR
jgi:dipeptidyl aminopeptidase/acylaminoacyl peptidase